MARAVIRNDALWVQHLDDGQAIRRSIERLRDGEQISLLVDGFPILFRKPPTSSDSPAMSGIRPDVAYRSVWTFLTARGRESLSVKMLHATEPVDGDLSALTKLLPEWESPEDAAAYDGLIGSIPPLPYSPSRTPRFESRDRS